MDKLDQLITKFKEVKEELEKARVATAPPSIIADDQMRAKALGKPTNPNAPVAKEEEKDEDDMEKGFKSPEMRAHALSDASRAAKPTVSQGHRPAARAQKDMDWLLGQGMHAVTGGQKPPGFTSGSAHDTITVKPTKLTGLDKDEGTPTGIRKKPVTVSPAVGAMPKLKEGFLAHPGAHQNKPAASATPPTQAARPPQVGVQTQVPLGGNPVPPTGVSTFHGHTGTGRAVMGSPEPTISHQAPQATPPKKDLHADLSSRVRAMQGKDGHNKLHGLVRKDEEGPKFEKTVNMSTNPAANDMTKGCNEKIALNKGGQWNLTKAEDEKGRCTNCGSKACVGDCKTK